MAETSGVKQKASTVIARLTRQQKRAVMLGLDLVAAGLSSAVTLAMHPAPGAGALCLALVPLVPAAAVALGLDRIRLATYEGDGILRSAALALFAAVALRAVAQLTGIPLSDAALILFALLVFVGAAGLRLLLRNLVLAIQRDGAACAPVVIYGAGTTGLQLAAALRRGATHRPVAFLDDNPALHGLRLAGLYVHPPSALSVLLRRHEAARVILAMPALDAAQRRRIAERIAPLGAPVLAVPSFDTLLTGQGAMLLPVPAERFLNRSPVDPSRDAGRGTYAGQTVLVTGAGGSIGAELCRQLLACQPARLLLLEQSEAALYTIDKDLRVLAAGTEVTPVLASVTDRAALDTLLARHRVDTVFHVAACKHVPMVEANPFAGVETNVFGTRTLAEAVEAAGVARVILVSTDKAVRPGNVMGATKRLAELCVQDIGQRAAVTRFAIVRFGNVLGSSGSVVPLFREQIARGGPVTLTHPEVTRYFMTIAEAAQLVLATGAFAPHARQGADVFVLDMGAPVRIRDLADQMIAAAGLAPRDAARPDGAIEVRVTGLRPGEKLHEELLLGQHLLPTPHPRILRAEEPGLSEFEVAQALRALKAALAERDEAALRHLLFAAVAPDRPDRPRPEAQRPRAVAG
jgi:FlaA1/EpsC-like NDP-sugar epimerase